jgi:4-hydroxybenzoate-CoA ligase
MRRAIIAICGRTDDMFKVSGIWVSPFEVEAALIAIRRCSRPRWCPRPTRTGCSSRRPSWCSRRAPAEGLPAELKEHVKAAIGQWKYPRWIDFVEALPKTATGKIQRFKLRD